MRPTLRSAGIAVLGALLVLVLGGASALSDSEIRRRLIAESLSTYPGPCPCPWNIKRNGKPCGTASAYSKPGGRSPLCYDRDVTDAMVREYRARAGR